tara:strand:+ start:2073 stop:2192 length:120 start_codon:yes stop_codon:yes gene_type:complete
LEHASGALWVKKKINFDQLIYFRYLNGMAIAILKEVTGV